MYTPEITAKKMHANDLSETSSAPDGALLDGVAHSADVLIRNIKDDSSDLVHTASQEVQHQYADLKAYAKRSLSSLEDEVSAKPVQSMAIALVAGALLSIFFTRRV